ncbi:MAG: hypothetical protein JSV25_04205 [Spirochaetota bacterium]|nr:MAG: hypothetical protein JSV25_04205 [Spirochaetota bacterium]
MKLKKTTGIYCIAIGAINVIMWVMLITTNQVPNIREALISYIIHWFSEFSMAITMIIAGVLVLKQQRMQWKIFYFGSGMLLCAIVGALLYYLIYFDIFIFIMSFVITILALVFAILHYHKLRDFYYLSLGTIIYGGINILGNTLQKTDQPIIVYVSLPLLLAVILLIVSLKSEIRYE